MNFDGLRDRILSAMNNFNNPCSVCGNNTKSLIPGFMMQSIQQNPTGITLGGPGLPMVGRVCTKCGHIETFALRALFPDLNLDGPQEKKQ